MSVIIASISSGLLAYWASKERAKTKHAHDNLETLRSIPDVPISSLQTLSGHLPHQDAKKLVFVRGVVLPRSSANNVGATNGEAASPSPETYPLKSDTTGQEAVVIEDRVTHIYNEFSGNMHMRGLTQEQSKKVLSRTRRQVPFILSSHISNACNHYVFVNFDGTEDQVPLERVCSDRKELFTRGHKGSELTVDVLREEEVLPLGTVVTALGLLSSDNEIPTIKPFKELPLFLTTKSKQELIAQLSEEVEQLTDKGYLLSQMSVGLAGFAIGAFVTHLMRELVRST